VILFVYRVDEAPTRVDQVPHLGNKFWQGESDVRCNRCFNGTVLDERDCYTLRVRTDRIVDRQFVSDQHVWRFGLVIRPRVDDLNDLQSAYV